MSILQVTDEELGAFTKRCLRHDWHYQRANGAAYQKGSDERKALHQEVKDDLSGIKGRVYKSIAASKG